ncbi:MULTISPECIES: HAD-IB family hydrolase [unclassified Agrococcus]|uniref:HAD-IB family hydrolase n=1 Tax=unclassified Agrococcus TaxID=2615065 RepID=UPI0036076623
MSPTRTPHDLGDAHVLLTGATGFVGQAILERLLATFPSTTVSILVRGKGDESAEDRAAALLRKPVFDRWRAAVGDEAADAAIGTRVTVIDSGLDEVAPLPSGIDVVIHSAASVSFDPPIDESFDTNLGGAVGLYEAVRATGADPHVVHISTCYVGGLRKGVALEQSLDHDVDWRLEHAAARQARERVEMQSRMPELLTGFLDAARAEHGKAGPLAVASASEEARRAWVTEQLVEAGRTRAQSLGWTDVYTLTKAFAERAAEQLWGAERRLSIVRPSIIESAAQHPYPGWIDGFKVADPLIVAYGKGQLPEFPGSPDSVLDVIPVDHVVNAALAAAMQPPPAGRPAYYQVSSGRSNPLPYHEIFQAVRRYFTAHPMQQGDAPVIVPNWTFPGGTRVDRRLAQQQRAVTAAQRALGALPTTDRTRRWRTATDKAVRDIGRLRQFIALYKVYVQSEIIFDDANTRALHASLPPEVAADRGFDITAVDWDHYLQDVHLPAVTELATSFSARRRAKASAAIAQAAASLPQRSDVLAVFDLEGTLIDSNIVEQYLWVRTQGVRRTAYPAEVARMLRDVPRYLAAERRDRGEFIREFMRRYEGMSVDRLERIVQGGYRERMLSHASADAIERVLQHRAAGHRTVLVTGSFDRLAAPVAALFDEVVAGSMHERDGRLTGYLATPPLVDEARASWLAQYAHEHGADLSASYGYGDSHADLGWLALVGNPTAVNPDGRLAGEADRRGWTSARWRRGPANRARALLRTIPEATA